MRKFLLPAVICLSGCAANTHHTALIGLSPMGDREQSGGKNRMAVSIFRAAGDDTFLPIFKDLVGKAVHKKK